MDEKIEEAKHFECWCTLNFTGASYPVAHVKTKNKREARTKFKRSYAPWWTEEAYTFTVYEIQEEDALSRWKL